MDGQIESETRSYAFGGELEEKAVDELGARNLEIHFTLYVAGGQSVTTSASGERIKQAGTDGICMRASYAIGCEVVPQPSRVSASWP